MFTLTGTVQLPDRTLVTSGTLLFRPRPDEFISDDGRHTIREAKATLGVDGTFTVTLEWKEGLQYHVRLSGGVGWDPFWITCGTDPGEVADGASVDIATLTPVDVPSPLDPGYIKGDQGDTGPQGPAGPNAPQAGGAFARSVQGLFTIAQPSASGMTTGFYALAMDPSVSGRVWGNGLDFSTFGYYEPATNTYVAKTLHPGTGAMHELQFTTAHAWLLTGSNADRNGQLWRSPLPDASGNGLSWTKMFDLAAPPGGLVAGVNSFFRPQCIALLPNGGSWHVWLLEYGTTVTGGPSIYYSPDAGATWTKPKTWANAKHGHSVYAINGGPVVMLGDAGFTDLGLWRATAANGTGTWNRISKYGEAAGGNTQYGIGAVAGTFNGNAVLFYEYDGDENFGPLVFPGGASTAQIWSMRPTYPIPQRYFGTMRTLTQTPAGDLMWVQTTENGAFGTHDDTIWISKADEHTAPVLCGSISGGPSSRQYGRAVSEGNGYVWFGNKRCHVEEFDA